MVQLSSASNLCKSAYFEHCCVPTGSSAFVKAHVSLTALSSSLLAALLQVLEDVSEEHARKTITLDPHPHLAVSAASIHPCRHAEVMKKLADGISGGDGAEFPLEQ